MSKQPFDEYIRRALENIRPDYDPSHWNRMANRLHEEELLGTDEALDQTVQDTLSDYRDPVVNHSWTALSSELDYLDWRETYFISKVAESFILLLLFITFFHLVQPTSDQPLSESISMESVEELPGTSTEMQKHLNDDIHLDESAQGLNGEHNKDGSIPPVQSDGSPLSGQEAQEAGSSGISKPTGGIRKSTSAVSLVPPRQSFLNASEGGNDFILRDMRSFISSTDAAGVKSRANTGLKRLPGRLAKVYYRELTHLQDAPSIDLFKPSSSMTWLSAYASSDVNVIQTPYDIYYGLDGYTSVSAGFGMGLALEWFHGDWVMGTGFSYARKSYQPRRVIEVYKDPEEGTKYQGVSLDHIGFSMFSLPITMRNYIFRDGPWSMYGGGGVQLHLITHADYDRLNYPVRNNVEVEHLPQPAFFTGKGKLALDKKPTPPGLMEGGSFFSSSYFSVDLMVGLEYELESNWILFVQPMFMHSLINEGLGPNQDRIQTYTIRFGARSPLD